MITLAIDNYTKPVSELLSYGNCLEILKKDREWPNYVEALGFNQSHIPALIDMMLDIDLQEADSDSLEVWAPVHAWRTLGQLRATEAVQPLLDYMDDVDIEDDWAHEEVPEVLARIGAPALESVAQYLRDPNKPEFSYGAAARALPLLAQHHPEQSGHCARVLLDSLGRYADNPDTLNGTLLAELFDLHERGIIDLKDHAQLIEQAFQANAVDLTVVGDWEDVQIELGLLEERITPGRNYIAEKYFGIAPEESADFRFDFDALDQPAPQPHSKTIVKPPKIGRNDPCPCGSGKKYKKCCLLKA